MLNIKKSWLLISLILAITSCKSEIPNLEKNPQYQFKTKVLDGNYLLRKLNHWLQEPSGENNLVKEIIFSMYKQPALFRDLMLENPEILDNILRVQAVQTRISFDNNFRLFIESCQPEVIGQFLVNTYTSISQYQPSAAMDNQGNFVIVWQSGRWTGSGQDGSSYGIYGQRYNSTGEPNGSEFRVNTFTTGNQRFAAVAMDRDGDFVVTWTSGGPYSLTQDGSNYGIFAQRYSSAGLPAGSEFQVNSDTVGSQSDSAIAMDANGNFVITWAGTSGILAQQYERSGIKKGAELQINPAVGGGSQPSAAMDRDGNFVITWEGVDDGSYSGVFARRYNSAGVEKSSEFRVNTWTTGNQTHSAIGMDQDGNFVVAWAGYGEQDGSESGIFAQRYKSTGERAGSEFQVNTYSEFRQNFTAIGMDKGGDFVISWDSYYLGGQDSGISAQRYNSAGIPQGSEFIVNNYTTDYQYLSSVAMDGQGGFVITWVDYMFDGSDDGIFAQRFSPSGRQR
jgi:hypothetical protein